MDKAYEPLYCLLLFAGDTQRNAHPPPTLLLPLPAVLGMLARRALPSWHADIIAVYVACRRARCGRQVGSVSAQYAGASVAGAVIV